MNVKTTRPEPAVSKLRPVNPGPVLAEFLVISIKHDLYGAVVVDVSLVVVVLVNESRPAIPGSEVSATGTGGPATEIAPLSVKVTNPVEEQTQNSVPAGSSSPA
jgi:hypothetical protein